MEPDQGLTRDTTASVDRRCLGRRLRAGHPARPLLGRGTAPQSPPAGPGGTHAPDVPPSRSRLRRRKRNWQPVLLIE